MSQTSEPLFQVHVYTHRGLIIMACYEDGCEFDVDMDLYTAHMDKSGKWQVRLKREKGA